MQDREHVDRGFVTLADRAWRVAFDKSLAAEILDDEESRIKIRVINRGRRERALAQTVGDGDEWLDVFGQMYRSAIGFAVINRRTIRAPRRVHQNDGSLASKQPRVGTRRGIAGHTLTLRVDETGAGEKLPKCLEPYDLRRRLAESGDLGGSRRRSQRRAMAQGNIDPVGRQPAARAFRPFDQRDDPLRQG